VKALDVWPPLLIMIHAYRYYNVWPYAALEHNDRICDLRLIIPSSEWKNVLVSMQQPFPALTRLYLRTAGETAPVDPASFLGGSAPSLQTLILDHIPFPGLPKLLLSATRLVHLDSSFRVLSTRGDAHLPLRVDQPQKTCH